MKFKKNINQAGIGLGLTICKKISDALKGHIQCKSTPGLGTKFTIDFPINRPEGNNHQS